VRIPRLPFVSPLFIPRQILTAKKIRQQNLPISMAICPLHFLENARLHHANQKNLGTAVWRATLAASEFPSKISWFHRISATGELSLFQNSSFQRFTITQTPPFSPACPFPRAPVLPTDLSTPKAIF
jgi:hypothetical protein